MSRLLPISSPRSLAEVQVLRGAVDAIITGVGTVLADDPRLTLRPAGDGATPPLRVVLDTELRTSTSARLFAPQPEGEAGGEVWIWQGGRDWEDGSFASTCGDIGGKPFNGDSTAHQSIGNQ